MSRNVSPTSRAAGKAVEPAEPRADPRAKEGVGLGQVVLTIGGAVFFPRSHGRRWLQEGVVREAR